MSLYRKSRRISRRVQDWFYFKIGKRLKKVSFKDLATFLVVFIVIFMLSGGLVAMSNPAPVGAIFTRERFMQSLPETTVYFILTSLLFLSVYLMGRGGKNLPIALFLFFTTLLGMAFLVLVILGV